MKLRKGILIGLIFGIMIVSPASTLPIALAEESPYLSPDDFISMVYNFKNLSIEEIQIGEKTYHVVECENCLPLVQQGAPILPVRVAKILIPPYKRVKNIILKGEEREICINRDLNVVTNPFEIYSTLYEKKVAENGVVLPPLEVKPTKDRAFFEKNLSEIYPSVRFESLGVQYKRGFPILLIKLYPVRYEKDKRAVLFSEKMELTLQLEPSSDPGLSSSYRGLLDDLIDLTHMVDNVGTISNYIPLLQSAGQSSENSQLCSLTYTGSNGVTSKSSSPRKIYDMLIITTSGMLNAKGKYSLFALKRAHEKRGLRVKIVTVEEIYSIYKPTTCLATPYLMHLQTSIEQSGSDLSGSLCDSLAGEKKKSVREDSDLPNWLPGTTKRQEISIRKFIKFAYKNWGIDYVLLVGDDDKIWKAGLLNLFLRAPLDVKLVRDRDIEDSYEVPTTLIWLWDMELWALYVGINKGQKSGEKVRGKISGPMKKTPPFAENPKDKDAPSSSMEGISYKISMYLPDNSSYLLSYQPNASQINKILNQTTSTVYTPVTKPNFFIVEYATAASDLPYACLDGELVEHVNRDFFDLYKNRGTIQLNGKKVNFNFGENNERGLIVPDILSEVYVGRAPVGSVQELFNFVKKTLDYMEADEENYRDVLLVAEYLGWSMGYGDTRKNYCSKPIPTDFYHVVKLYDKRTQNGPVKWSKDDLISRINEGKADILNHIGHSLYDRNMRLSPSDISTIRNDKPLFAYSVGCFAGAFDFPDSISEYYTTKSSHMAMGFIGKSHLGWTSNSLEWAPAETLDKSFFEIMFDYGIPIAGKANQLSKEKNLCKILLSLLMLYETFETNLLGDPAISIKAPYTYAGSVAKNPLSIAVRELPQPHQNNSLFSKLEFTSWEKEWVHIHNQAEFKIEVRNPYSYPIENITVTLELIPPFYIPFPTYKYSDPKPQTIIGHRYEVKALIWNIDRILPSENKTIYFTFQWYNPNEQLGIINLYHVYMKGYISPDGYPIKVGASDRIFVTGGESGPQIMVNCLISKENSNNPLFNPPPPPVGSGGIWEEWQNEEIGIGERFVIHVGAAVVYQPPTFKYMEDAHLIVYIPSGIHVSEYTIIHNYKTQLNKTGKLLMTKTLPHGDKIMIFYVPGHQWWRITLNATLVEGESKDGTYPPSVLYIKAYACALKGEFRDDIQKETGIRGIITASSWFGGWLPIRVKNRPPIPIISPFKKTINTGEIVTFSGENSYDPDEDEHDTITEYQWLTIRLGDADNFVSMGEGAVTKYTWLTPGRYLVILKVKDSRGSTAETYSVINVTGEIKTLVSKTIYQNATGTWEVVTKVDGVDLRSIRYKIKVNLNELKDLDIKKLIVDDLTLTSFSKEDRLPPIPVGRSTRDAYVKYVEGSSIMSFDPSGIVRQIEPIYFTPEKNLSAKGEDLYIVWSIPDNVMPDNTTSVSIEFVLSTMMRPIKPSIRCNYIADISSCIVVTKNNAVIPAGMAMASVGETDLFTIYCDRLVTEGDSEVEGDREGGEANANLGEDTYYRNDDNLLPFIGNGVANSTHNQESQEKNSVENETTSNVTYTLDVVVYPKEGGYIEINPLLQRYGEGAVVVLTPHPSNGYVFDHWSVDATDGVVIEGNILILEMRDNTTVEAYFTKTSYSTPPQKENKLGENTTTNIWDEDTKHDNDEKAGNAYDGTFSKPYIIIRKPKINAINIGKRSIDFRRTIVIGPLLLEGKIKNGSGSNEIRIYINDKLAAVYHSTTYRFKYSERGIYECSIRIVAKNGAFVTTKDLKVLVINLYPRFLPNKIWHR